ncbi:uncharacterized protein TRIADDRAFT_60600 [Trichoplax adhaerens]|uniref:Aminotransferase class I/classII large domain-containing protein n=1 Tax=Trichoplax adhaerens TaxID=10228 RepID=B3S8N3_TRIAD|nr:hypothetical protein TRIADDRAFT_60600 [Trichoplax adhaerens]EDV20914.1 hypothetical protein TRIADDRAFT_60600 [Trichoplax adhaerens]|eukprot:XP_002116558.1 hypothetical protein TRIADDRAFT_60600 [Trichoplax adhaerens]
MVSIVDYYRIHNCFFDSPNTCTFKNQFQINYNWLSLSIGIEQLRNAIASFHKRYDGLDFSADQIIVAPGSKELLFLTMLVMDADIIVPSPTWTTYLPQSKLAGRKSIILSSRFEDEWRLTPEILDKAINEQCTNANKVLIFCNPDNPTGTSYTEQQLTELSKVLRKHSVIVLSDEIYGRTNYKNAHLSIAKFYKEGTILMSGLSKWASLGGWRVGYAIYPKELAEVQSAVRSAGSHTYSCTSAPIQYAVADVLQNFEACDTYIYHIKRILEAVSKYCYEQLTSVGVKCIQSTGGFYMLPDFEVIRPGLEKNNITTCQEMCEDLFQKRSVVVMAGGPAFLRPLKELTVRLCYIDFDGTLALNESINIGPDKPLTREFVEQFCSHQAEGIKVP